MSATNVCQGCGKSTRRNISSGGCRTGGNCRGKKGMRVMQDEDVASRTSTCKKHGWSNLASHQICPGCNCVKCGKEMTRDHDQNKCHEDKKCDICRKDHTTSMCRFLAPCNDCDRKHHRAIPCKHFCEKCDSSLHMATKCDAVACDHCGSYRHPTDRCKVPECRDCNDGSHHTNRDCPNAVCTYCQDHDVDNAIGHVAYDARENGCPYILDNPDIDDETKLKACNWRNIRNDSKTPVTTVTQVMASTPKHAVGEYNFGKSSKMLEEALTQAKRESADLVRDIGILEDTMKQISTQIERRDARIEALSKEMAAMTEQRIGLVDAHGKRDKRLAELKILLGKATSQISALSLLVVPAAKDVLTPDESSKVSLQA